MLVGRYGRNTLDYNRILDNIREQISHYVTHYNVSEQDLRVLINPKDMQLLLDGMSWCTDYLNKVHLKPRLYGSLVYEVEGIQTTVVLCDV